MPGVPENAENVSVQAVEDEGPSGFVGSCRAFEFKKFIGRARREKIYGRNDSGVHPYSPIFGQIRRYSPVLEKNYDTKSQEPGSRVQAGK